MPGPDGRQSTARIHMAGLGYRSRPREPTPFPWRTGRNSFRRLDPALQRQEPEPGPPVTTYCIVPRINPRPFALKSPPPSLRRPPPRPDSPDMLHRCNSNPAQASYIGAFRHSGAPPVSLRSDNNASRAPRLMTTHANHGTFAQSRQRMTVGPIIHTHIRTRR